MKTILLAVGRTVESYYVSAINEYVARTKHYIPFDVEIIPELKNTKNLTAEQQKEKIHKNASLLEESSYILAMSF